MKEIYLKCNYSPGIFDNEYFIQFKGGQLPGTFLGGVFVVKDNVIINDKEESLGLVKIILARKDEETSQILIPSITDSGAFFKVLNEDIVYIEED